jgi:transcriptional regulator with XRE-family HTH domain
MLDNGSVYCVVTGAQIRAARAYLGMSQRELVEATGLSLPTIQRFESAGTDRAIAENVLKVQRALESRGIEFSEDGGVRPKG